MRSITLRARQFDPALWHGVDSRVFAEAIRGCMVDHLLRRHDLHGRSRARIGALLGDPTRTDYYFEEFDLV
jgi:hypothetical protein